MTSDAVESQIATTTIIHTKISLLHAATHHGIFATATRNGQSDAVLLASLGINLNSEHDRRGLLALIARGEVTPLARTSCDRTSAEHRLMAELIERGILEDDARYLVQRSWLCDTSHIPDRWYYALLLPARAATADTLRDYPILCMRAWLGDRTDPPAIHLREACSIALGEISTAPKRAQQDAREICAQRWNRYAGVLW